LLRGQEAGGADATAESKKAPEQRDAAAAWTEMRRSIESRFRTAPDKDRAAVTRDVLHDLSEFAKTYKGTEQAALALFNHGMLAAATEDFDAAAKSYQEALSQTKDPELRAAIEAQVAQLAIRPGQSPPAFTAKSLSGDEISLSKYKGKVLLLDFWATWCAPCIAELPNVKQVYNAYHEQGLEIVSISLDQDEKVLHDFIKQQGLNWTHVYNGSVPVGQDVATKYSVTAIPQMILIGRDGKIAGVQLRGEALEDAVKKAIAKPAQVE
jgi:peroxiredoxin